MFKLTQDQINKLDTWLEIQENQAVENQKQTITKHDPSFLIYNSCWEEGYPYTGAIGGGITYSYTPTSLGSVIKVKYSLTNEEIDLTEYDEW